MGDKDRTKLSRIKANLPIDIAQPVCPVDVDGNPLGTVAGLKVEVTDGTDTLDVITQDAAFGAATKGIALFGKYEVTPTAYADGDAVPIKVDANGRVVLESDIQLGAVELKNGTTDDRAIIKDGNTAAVADDALLVADANVKTVLTDASQKTQIVDGSGNVIGATSNRLNVDTVAEDNFEDDLTAVETWLELPKNIKAVSFVLDCSSNTKATLEYTFDRSASPAHAVESELGTLVNDVAGGYLAGAVAQVRMNNVDSNEVVEVKSALSTDLGGDNNDLVYTSKLTGAAGDAITIKYDDSTPASVDEVKSSLSTDLAGGDNDLVYTSKLAGTAGDAITIAYIDPGEIAALNIVVTGTKIVVNLAHDGSGITTTADDISSAISLDDDASALVGVANKDANNGSGVVTAMAETPLAGGVDAVVTTTTVTVTDTDIVIGLAKDTSNAITSTATQIKTEIEATPAADALVGVANKADNDGSGVVTVMAKTSLAGGVNAVAATLPKLWIIGIK